MSAAERTGVVFEDSQLRPTEGCSFLPRDGYPKFFANLPDQTGLDLAMSRDEALGSRAAVLDPGMLAAFANVVTVVFAEVSQAPTFHEATPDFAFALSRIGSRIAAFLSFARGFGRGNACPSSMYESAMSSSAERNIRRAAFKVFPWVTTPGKSKTTPMYQPSSIR
jgi:hypothetical protein